MFSTDSITFYELDWDTKYFGVDCAKAILKNTVASEDWNSLKKKFNNYKFISIQNSNSNVHNSKIIGKDTNAFLADVNIQFEKKVIKNESDNRNLIITNNYMYNEQILNLVNFKHSKFIKDTNLKKRGGEGVYTQWITNSFEKDEKYFIISTDEKNIPNGFLLFYNKDNMYVIDLIAASQSCQGIGTKMFNALEHHAYQNEIKKIKVGTQVDNIGAINFYNKLGFKQIECHQVFHLWNL